MDEQLQSPFYADAIIYPICLNPYSGLADPAIYALILTEFCKVFMVCSNIIIMKNTEFWWHF